MKTDDDKLNPEYMLRQIWNNHFNASPWHEALQLDESFPAAIAHSLLPVPAALTAALDYWRDQMVAAVDDIVQRYKNNPSESDEFWRRHLRNRAMLEMVREQRDDDP